jgi:hypothetical protein
MTYLMSSYAFSDLYTLFKPALKYAGYRPAVKENADSGALQKLDAEKKFLHVALKYDPPPFARMYLADAHFEACRVARRLGVPPLYMPDVENATLRVLWYPPGSGTVPHTDFNLFTIVCYRSHPAGLKRKVITAEEAMLDTYSPGLHIGDLGEMVGLGPATRHEVPPTDFPQSSIVYFASPRMDAGLPCGEYTFPATEGFPEKTVHTCGQWQIERVNRSRVYA